MYKPTYYTGLKLHTKMHLAIPHKCLLGPTVRPTVKEYPPRWGPRSSGEAAGVTPGPLTRCNTGLPSYAPWRPESCPLLPNSTDTHASVQEEKLAVT